jgi:hypothetical protein
VICGKDQAEHDANLRALLKRCKEFGVKLNPQKCKFSRTEVPFFGIVVGKDGARPNPRKLAAIKEMPAPSNIAELRTFLAVVNYMGRFSPKLADVSAPLRELNRGDKAWVWYPQHELAFQQLKDMFDVACLQFFDPTSEVFIEADASLVGLRACLLQRDTTVKCPRGDEFYNLRPIAFASKSLTETEQRFSNIERELLAVVYALEKFHQYTYSLHVRVLTDHKPLETITARGINCAPPRLQRMLYRSDRYTFRVTYRKGIHQYISDMLSRCGHKKGRDPMFKGLNVTVAEFEECLNVELSMLDKIRTATAADPVLQQLTRCVVAGWPESKDCPEAVKPYNTIKEVIGYCDGVLTKGDRVIVPETLRKAALKQIHGAHLGVTKCLEYARTAVYWPGMTADITTTVQACESCQENAFQQPRESMRSYDVPPHPWHTLGIDNFELNGKLYLILVDYLSKFPVIRKVSSTSAKETISVLRQVFSEYGIPNKLICDRGTNFTSKDMRERSLQNGTFL